MFPGRYLAESTLFINVAAVLHVFDIGLPVDEHGVPVKIVPNMTDGLLTYVVDFYVRISQDRLIY